MSFYLLKIEVKLQRISCGKAVSGSTLIWLLGSGSGGNKCGCGYWLYPRPCAVKSFSCVWIRKFWASRIWGNYLHRSGSGKQFKKT